MDKASRCHATHYPASAKKDASQADQEVHEVSLTLTALQPGIYWFVVDAHDAAGEAFRSSDILTVLPIPPGACPYGCSNNEPYKTELSKGSIEFAEHQAEALFAEAEAKRRQAKEQEEQKKAAEMAATRTTETAALKNREEEEAQQAAARDAAEHPACIVPALKGDTLTGARHALAKAHCRLGAIHQPAHHHGTLHVSAQSAAAGERLAGGARVTLWVGAKRASHRDGTR